MIKLDCIGQSSHRTSPNDYMKKDMLTFPCSTGSDISYLHGLISATAVEVKCSTSSSSQLSHIAISYLRPYLAFFLSYTYHEFPVSLAHCKIATARFNRGVCRFVASHALLQIKVASIRGACKEKEREREGEEEGEEKEKKRKRKGTREYRMLSLNYLRILDQLTTNTLHIKKNSCI